ncbi:MAG: pitrilysin family protein [Candidatus Zixiibacteriota bacterium]
MKRVMIIVSMAVLLSSAVTAKITLPTSNEFKLDNGLTVSVIERPQLPLFSLQLTFRAGSTFDPAGKEGLASLASDMLMRGTATRSDKQIADQIAFGGGTMTNTCGFVAAGFNGEFLTTQGEQAIEILADLVRNSTFATEELEKTRTRTLGFLQSRRENPGTVANDAIWEAILGDSRYAHFSGGLSHSVQALTRDDIVQFAQNHYTPDNCILVVCGDITTASVREWVTKYFGDWTGRAVLAPEETSFPTVTGREVVIYDKQDATQTQIRIGGNGIPLNHPDYPALEVARTVYGGTFASRLMDEIRVNRGLTYGVSCRASRFKPGGLLYVTTFTKNATVAEVIDIIFSEAVRIQEEPMPDSELADGANYQCGTYPLDFETNDALASVFANMWLNNLDKSFYEDFQERLRAVTVPQAMAAARSYFPRDIYKLVLVGKADEIKSQVEKYGPVTVRPFTQ